MNFRKCTTPLCKRPNRLNLWVKPWSHWRRTASDCERPARHWWPVIWPWSMDSPTKMVGKHFLYFEFSTPKIFSDILKIELEKNSYYFFASFRCCPGEFAFHPFGSPILRLAPLGQTRSRLHQSTEVRPALCFLQILVQALILIRPF